MPIKDYFKDWKIIHFDKGPFCQDGDVITIGKPDSDNKVTIKCNKEDPAGFDGWYDEETNTIKVDGYVIRLVQCIKLIPAEGLREGSWTAEDQGPWPGDG